MRLNNPITGPAHSAPNCAGVSPWMGHSAGPPSARYSAVPVTICTAGPANEMPTRSQRDSARVGTNDA